MYIHIYTIKPHQIQLSKMANPQHLLLFTMLSLTHIFSFSQTPENCIDTSPIVPTTPLVSFLERLQETALTTFGPNSFDPKLYVDLSLKSNLTNTEKGFDNLPKTTNGTVLAYDLNAFMKDYLNGAEEDLVYVDPADFVRSPEGFLPAVESEDMREWALKVHSLWKLLSRKVADGVVEQPELHSLLPLPEPVMIPGSRFREVYYWDSYWVIRGLLASKMYDTAKGIVTNLISLIDEFGYVLNGARAYYTNRSQPPLLSSMIYDIYNRTGDMDFLNKSLPALLKEHDFWNSDVHSVTVRDAQGNSHLLSRYFAKWNQPRPESSTIDQQTASKLVDDYQKQHLYREIASAAESGWDFSTRWMRNSSDLTTLAATSILPVDLNSFIMKMELDIAHLSNITGDWATYLRFSEFAQTRKIAMNSILWNEEKGQWLDYWLSTNGTCKFSDTWEASNQNKNAYASNFIPLWVELFYSDEALVEKVMKSLQSSGLVREVGIATSLINSSQQWDLPNGWAPLQHLIVEGLVKSGSTEARSLAQDIAIRWITTNYVAYKYSGSMHEKYDVDNCGEFGGGGEYVPQTGFGWSNGVVLAFLEEFGWPQDLKTDC